MVRQGRTILVADHSAANRHRAVDELLRLDASAKVVEVSTSQECLNILKKSKDYKFDLAIVGSFPKVDQAKMLPLLSAVGADYVVVMTCEDPSPDFLARVAETNIYDCLIHPVTPNDLNRLILRSSIPKDPLSILVVDDTRVMRKVVMKVLNECQFALSISEAESCEMAVALCRKIPYHAIFMDLNMPCQDALEAAKQILQVQSKCRIIIMSSSVESMDDEVRDYGLAGFLKKPFYPKDIDLLVHNFFGLQPPNLANPDFLSRSPAPLVSEETVIVMDEPNSQDGDGSGIVFL